MSLPIRRPTDDQAPIIRQDGNYTLVITPKPVVTSLDGSKRLQSLGVPYGTMPRLILIHIMTEAVRTRSRQIVLGSTFTEWMRRMGFRTFSYGPRGSATILREQLDRLLACEWMIRWDSDNHNGDHEFAIREIKLSDEYVGVDRKNGGFKRELVMTEGFFSHLRDHAVPLNEHAIRQLRESATALDLYTWLAYRLPRINSNRALTINWSQLAVHFGNDQKNIRKFRHTIRDAWERHVSAVYPDAKADFSATVIKLFSSPPPLHQKIYPIQAIETKADAKGSARGGQLDDEAKDQEDSAIGPGGDKTQRFLTSLRLALGPAEARGWLQDVSFEKIDGAWTLITENEFKASWIRSHFDHALRKAAKVAEIEEPVQTNARPAKR